MERDLTPQELQKLRNNRTGLLLFQVSWILVFVCLIFVNLQIRGNFASWPPPGVERLGVGLPLVATLALTLSSALAHRGQGAMKAGSTAGFLANWRAVLGLSMAFIAIMAYEWLTVAITGQYSTMFRVMTAFHAIHALVIGLYLWRVYRFTQAGAYGSGSLFPVEAGVKLWDFVTVAWWLFFAVLYVL